MAKQKPLGIKAPTQASAHLANNKQSKPPNNSAISTTSPLSAAHCCVANKQLSLLQQQRTRKSAFMQKFLKFPRPATSVSKSAARGCNKP